LLLVDDSPEDLRLLQKTLEEQGGYRVWTAEGGQAALKSLQTLRPDAIFLDLFMPDMDGFSLLETFRTDPLLRNVPVIILTGADLTAEQRDLLSEFGQQMIHKGSLREIDLLNTLENSLRALRTDIPAKKA
jgi:CheY-like chemotaxis protein